MAKALIPSISFSRGVAFYVGAVVGSGVLILPGLAADLAGPASLLAWLFVAILSWPLAKMFADLAVTYPDPGGVATWATKAFGQSAGAIIGWYYFTAVAVGQVIVALTGASYLAFAFGFPRWALFVTAGLILAIGLVANWLGLRISGGLQLAISGTIVALLLITAFLNFPRVDHSQFSPFAPGGWTSVGRAIALIFWAFFGWEAIVHLATEFHDPRRDLLKSALTSVVVVGALYLTVASVIVGVGEQHGAESPGIERRVVPIATLMASALGVNGVIGTALLALAICVGTVNAYIASGSRLGYGLGRDGALPSIFGVLHPRFATPHTVLVLIAAIAGLAILVAAVFELGIEDLVWIPNSLVIAVYVVGSAAGIRLLSNRTQRLSAWISLIACLAAFPFVGRFIGAPVGLAGLCFVYLKLAKPWLRERA